MKTLKETESYSISETLNTPMMKFRLKVRLINNPKLYFIAMVIVLLEVFVIISNYIKASRPVIKHWRYLVSDISCHFDEEGDALPPAVEPSFSPNAKSIFFHETSCRGGLTSRQACSVEAAARSNPESDVYVLFSAPVTEKILKRTCLAKLLEFENVKMARVHIAEYSKGTILESILMEMADSRHPLEHASEILRFLSLNKWGGIYLDTDMMVVHSLEWLPSNWIVKQSDGSVPSAILSFGKDEVGKNITNAILKELIKSYNPYDWSVYGERAIHKVIKDMCPTILNVEECKGKDCTYITFQHLGMPQVAEYHVDFADEYVGLLAFPIEGLKIFPYQLFYPIHYTLWKLYFKPGTFSNAEPPYSYHMWSHLSSYEKIEKNSPYDMLAKKHCPTIYEMYGDKFGI